MHPSDLNEEVGRYWDGVSRTADAARTRWWQSPTIVRALNQQVCGQPVDGLSAGATLRALAAVEGRTPLARGVSIGGGAGVKERSLLEAGLVQHIDLFELSESRIEQGRAATEAAGLSNRLTFHRSDALAGPWTAVYDLVYWNNALHHMFDVDRALAWSRAVLQPGGLFLMDDFVGPDRFQFSRPALAAACAVRRALPESRRRHPRDPSQRVSDRIRNIDPEALAAADPSEAVQSGRILGGVRAYFPGAEVIATGGVVYNLALKDIVANFDEDDPADRAQLEALMWTDAVLTARPDIEPHYAVALAFKGDATPNRVRRAQWRAQWALSDRAPSRAELQALYRRVLPSARLRTALGRWRRR